VFTSNTAIGADSVATGVNSSAFGSGAQALGGQSAAFGFGNIANGGNSVAGGAGNTVTGNNSGAFGVSQTVRGNGSFSIGDPNTLNGNGSFVFGDGNSDNGGNTAGFGDNIQVIGSNNTVGGIASAAGSSVFGSSNTVNATNAMVIGNGSTVTGSNGIAIGNNVSVAGANGVAIGSGSNANFSGTAGNTYTMAGLTSAASRAAQSGPQQIVTSDAGGNLATSTLAGLGLASSADIGAINSQLTAINNRLNDLDTRTSRAYTGIAMAYATAGVPTLLPSEKFAATMNYGTFLGGNGLAINGAFRVSSKQLSGGVAYGLEGNAAGGRVGLRVGWLPSGGSFGQCRQVARLDEAALDRRGGIGRRTPAMGIGRRRDGAVAAAVRRTLAKRSGQACGASGTDSAGQHRAGVLSHSLDLADAQ
jgi:hypothetical protein